MINIYGVGGGWRHQPGGISSAGVVAITILTLMLSVVVCIITATYCYVRRPHLLQRLRRGGRASDYVGRCDASAQIPSPPPYSATVSPSTLFPPPYSPAGAAGKPPEYEVVLLRNGQCLYQRQAQSSVSDSEPHDDHLPHSPV